MVNALFLLRGDQDGMVSVRDDFSELISTIPTMEGRLRVLRTLAETFPEESHYWGHLARFLSYKAGDNVQARSAIETAMDLSPKDSSLAHVSGMIYRGEAYRLMEKWKRWQGEPSSEDELAIRHECENALGEFMRAAQLQSSSEYPYVGITQLCIRVIEWAFVWSTRPTYAAFFTDSRFAWYADLLSTAEDALDEMDVIRGDGQASDKSLEVRTNVRALYDDFEAVLEGWRALLDRTGADRAGIRRRIARLHRVAAGSWVEAPDAAREEAFQLLESNLDDDGLDSRSLREWFRLARFMDVSLDRAAELASYWAEEGSDRIGVLL